MGTGDTAVAATQEEKAQLRKRMRSLRLVVDQKDGPVAAVGVLKRVMAILDQLGITSQTAVAGYWPIATELDIRPLIARLGERGCPAALPVVAAKGKSLLFRSWSPTDELEPGPLGTMHPLESQPEVLPDVLFVPALAFDRAGYRLGQGAGYYDRTLAELRQQKEIVVVGVGFAIQLVERVPHAHFDERLDWVVTDQETLQVRR